MAGLPFETWLEWDRKQRLAFVEAMTDSELRNLKMSADEYFCAALGYSPEPRRRRTAVPCQVKCAVAQRHGATKGGVSVVLCPRCGSRGEVHWLLRTPRFVGLHIDHIQPKSKGGRHEPDNLRLLCPHCNISRGNRGS